jgi:acetyl/propionyl-CoA carboxylase alpha subunit
VSPSGPWVREDSGIQTGSRIGSEYDPLLSKISVWAPDRAQALARIERALSECVITGLSTNLGLLDALLVNPAVRAGDYDTTFVERELGAVLASAPSHGVSDEMVAAAAAAVVARRETSRVEAAGARAFRPRSPSNARRD